MKKTSGEERVVISAIALELVIRMLDAKGCAKVDIIDNKLTPGMNANHVQNIVNNVMILQHAKCVKADIM